MELIKYAKELEKKADGLYDLADRVRLEAEKRKLS